jgi:putative endopeptidase
MKARNMKKNNLKVKIALVALSLIPMSGLAQNLQKSGIDRTNLDLKVKPGENFYKYAVGGWMATHPLDAQHPQNGAAVDLYELNTKQLNGLILEFAAKKMPQGTPGQKIGSLYRMYMDSIGRNNLGSKPIQPILRRIESINDRKELRLVMQELAAKGHQCSFFGLYLSNDPENTDKYMFSVSGGGIGLPQECYGDSLNDQQKMQVEAYKGLMKDMYVLSGYTEEEARKKFELKWAIENQIAPFVYNQNKVRDPHATIHKMTWAQLKDTYKTLDFDAVVRIYEYPTDIDSVNVDEPEVLSEVEKVLATADLEALKACAEADVINASAGYLSDAFYDRYFDYNKVLSGVQQDQPRWKKGVAFVNSFLEESIGKMYVEKYFPESSKKQIYQLVKNLQKAFEQRILENTWMTETTKKKAIDKLHNIIINVGYPDKWQDMEKYIQIDESKNFVENMEIIVPAVRKGKLEKRWRKPVDKTKMACSPQTVNAFYHPYYNSINFPAAFLQPPFFDPSVDDAANYGAIGVVIGHEMSHGFDDQGCQFDKDGNLRNWWTAEDKEAYDARTKILAKWFGQQEVVPGQMLDGNKTLGENIGDNGGINIAFRALQNVMKEKNLTEMDGFTPEQRFFLSYARIWACNVNPQYEAYAANVDTHSPHRLRVNAALPMVDSWYQAFEIKKDDKMFVPAEQRAHIW